MKKIILSSVIGLMFVGCVYDKATLEYAQKNNLSEDFYSDVKIQKVVNNNTVNDKIFINFIKKDVIASRCEEVRNYQRKIYSHALYLTSLDHTIPQRYGMPKTPKMAYNQCISTVTPFFVITKEKKNKKNIFSIKDFGYFGYEKLDNDNKTIFFTKDTDYKKLYIQKALKKYFNTI